MVDEWRTVRRFLKSASLVNQLNYLIPSHALHINTQMMISSYCAPMQLLSQKQWVSNPRQSARCSNSGVPRGGMGVQSPPLAGSEKHALQNIQNDCHQWLSDSSRVHQICFRPGLHLRPRWGSLQRSPSPLRWFNWGERER